MIGSYTRKRTNRGSALTEMGPAMLVLLMIIFFPVLDMIGMAVSYCSCAYLNMQQTKEAAVVAASDATSASGQVQKGVVDAWLNFGIGKFVKTTAYPSTTVTYRNGTQDTNTKITDKIVRVTTTCSCQPFLTIPIPYFIHVPGVSAPMTFTLSSEAPMENPDNAG